MKPTLFPAPSEEKSGPRRPGLSFKSDNSFFGASEGKISGVFVFNYRPFPLVRPVIRITFTLSMHRLIPFDDKYGCSYWSSLSGSHQRDDKRPTPEEVRVDGINLHASGQRDMCFVINFST